MKCKKCGVEMMGLEEHHVWPKFMNNKRGDAPDPNTPSRVSLCFNCHQKKLHRNIREILRKYSKKPEYKNEHYLWKNIEKEDQEKAIVSVINKTKEFLK